MILTYLLLLLPLLLFRLKGLSWASKFLFVGVAELILAAIIFALGNITQSNVIVMAMMLVVPAEIIFLLSFVTGIALYIIRAVRRSTKNVRSNR